GMGGWGGVRPSSEDRGLAGGALWPAGDSQAGVSWYHDAVQESSRGLSGKNRQRSGVCQTVKGIERTSLADAQSINKEQQDGWLSRHEGGHVRDRDLICCGEFLD